MPTTKTIEEKVTKISKYADTLIDLPYRWWTGDDREDFHYYDDPKDIKFIKKHGIACGGLINILM